MEPMTMISAGVGAASGALGIAQSLGLGRRAAERNQLEQQRKLSEQQARIQNESQIKMWRDTNYEAQMGELKKAGLNPALLYGKGGGGGTTVGAGIGGGQAANAAATQSANTQSAGMGIQGAMMLSQLELMKSQANKANAEADAIRGYKADQAGAGTNLLGAQKGEAEERTRGHKLENDWREFIQTPDEAIGGQSLAERQMRLTSNKLIAEMRKIDEELKAIGVNIIKGGAEIQRINADTKLKQQVYDQLQKLNPMEVETITKQLEMLKNNPANTEQGQWATAILGWLGELAGLGLKGAMTKSFITPKKSGGLTIHNWNGEQ